MDVDKDWFAEEEVREEGADPFGLESPPPEEPEFVVLHEEGDLKVVLARGGEVARAVEEALEAGRPASPLEFPVGYLVGEQVVVAQGLVWLRRAREEGRPYLLGLLRVDPGALVEEEERGEEGPPLEEVRLLEEEVRGLKRLLSRTLSRLRRERDPGRARELLERVRQARALLEG
ncbi:hypothetical protein HRbin39_01110 [bacterium HR39]|nr:hypothetical protein HRbin39_01110 [bacterium HR39]